MPTEFFVLLLLAYGYLVVTLVVIAGVVGKELKSGRWLVSFGLTLVWITGMVLLVLVLTNLPGQWVNIFVIAIFSAASYGFQLLK